MAHPQDELGSAPAHLLRDIIKSLLQTDPILLDLQKRGNFSLEGCAITRVSLSMDENASLGVGQLKMPILGLHSESLYFTVCLLQGARLNVHACWLLEHQKTDWGVTSVSIDL